MCSAQVIVNRKTIKFNVYNSYKLTKKCELTMEGMFPYSASSPA